MSDLFAASIEAHHTLEAMVVPLFERGFAEDRIQEALRHCSTLDAAVKWLSADSDVPSSDRAGRDGAEEPDVVAKASPIAEPVYPLQPRALVDSKAPGPAGATLSVRRRATRKIGGASFVAPAPLLVPSNPSVAVSAAPALRPLADSAAPALKHEPQPLTGISKAKARSAPTDATQVLREASPSHASSRSLHGRDSSAFWNQAASRFRSAMTSAPVDSACRSKRARPADDEEGRGSSEQEQASSDRRPRPRHSEQEQEEQEQDDLSSAAETKRPKVAAEERREASSIQEHRGLSTTAAHRGTELPSVQAEEEEMGAGHKEAELEGFSPTRFPVTARSSSASPQAMILNSQKEVCGICCDDVPAFRAVRLGCRHGWYCATCVVKHAEARLAVGATTIPCPECCTPIAERNLKKMLPPEIIERLLTRSIEQAVSSTADLWSCPTPNCTMRVALEEGEIPRLKCVICRKTSCLRCQAQPYHTGRTCEQHRERLRLRGGKACIQQAADTDANFMKWIEETGTRQCPTCRMGVTKQNLESQSTQRAECHKMLCRNCNTRFCFKCLRVLTDTFTCGCSIDAHGFVDPDTGKRLEHLKKPLTSRGRGKATAKRRARG